MTQLNIPLTSAVVQSCLRFPPADSQKEAPMGLILGGAKDKAANLGATCRRARPGLRLRLVPSGKLTHQSPRAQDLVSLWTGAQGQQSWGIPRTGNDLSTKPGKLKGNSQFASRESLLLLHAHTVKTSGADSLFNPRFTPLTIPFNLPSYSLMMKMILVASC